MKIKKPCGLLNIYGYYDNLFTFLDNAVNQQFIRKEHKDMLLVDVDPENMIKKFINYKVIPIDKCIDTV